MPDDFKKWQANKVLWGGMEKLQRVCCYCLVSLVELWPLNATVPRWRPPAGFTGPGFLGWMDYFQELHRQDTGLPRRKRSNFYFLTGLCNHSLVSLVFFHALSPSVKYIHQHRKSSWTRCWATGAFQTENGHRLAVKGIWCRKVNKKNNRALTDETCQHSSSPPNSIKIFWFLICVTKLKKKLKK